MDGYGVTTWQSNILLNLINKFFYIKMETAIKEIILKIKRMGTENFTGMMEDLIKETGKMEFK